MDRVVLARCAGLRARLLYSRGLWRHNLNKITKYGVVNANVQRFTNEIQQDNHSTSDGGSTDRNTRVLSA